MEKVVSKPDRREIRLRTGKKFAQYFDEDRPAICAAAERVRAQFSESEIDTARRVLDAMLDAAAVGIVEKVISFLFLIPSSMLSTVSALGAQNIGAGKPERAIRTLRYAVLLAVSFGVLASITIQFTAEQIVALFTDRSTAAGAQVVRLGGQYLRGYIFDCIFAGIHFSFSGYFCACGKSGLSFLHNIFAIVLVRIPGVYLTSTLFPATLLPMGLATAAGSACSVLICLIAFAVIQRKAAAPQAEG